VEDIKLILYIQNTAEPTERDYRQEERLSTPILVVLQCGLYVETHIIRLREPAPFLHINSTLPNHTDIHLDPLRFQQTLLSIGSVDRDDTGRRDDPVPCNWRARVGDEIDSCSVPL